MRTIQFMDLGLSEYGQTWERQELLMKGILDRKMANQTLPEAERLVTPGYLLFVEHPPVYTLGKNGEMHNLLLSSTQLADKKVSFYQTNRGGDITFHGPGQLVGYPILDLENFGMGLRQYIYSVEEAIIRTLAQYEITSSRDPKATGVWLDVGLPTARKICAIGVKSSRFVTMHGFALNVNTDLDYFRYINPCGFIDKGVTSMEKELGGWVDFDKVKRAVLSFLLSIFDAEVEHLLP
ncbi:MAG: lipoyl(octanoyl) transferase LipB [Bacteroidetes bacterium]|nr:lipoyl(octanoyl) transferase LipB [Bacteroidota bacterium]MCL6102934.1 lipoyl(octanoyl) transferase LipB [Bacteroidota bacterium]